MIKALSMSFLVLARQPNVQSIESFEKKIVSSRDVFDKDNTWNQDEKLSSQVLCDDEFEDVAPRSEILATAAPFVEVFPPTKEPIEAVKVVPRVRR